MSAPETGTAESAGGGDMALAVRRFARAVWRMRHHQVADWARKASAERAGSADPAGAIAVLSELAVLGLIREAPPQEPDYESETAEHSARYYSGDGHVTIDGRFTVADLERVIAGMRQRGAPGTARAAPLNRWLAALADQVGPVCVLTIEAALGHEVVVRTDSRGVITQHILAWEDVVMSRGDPIRMVAEDMVIGIVAPR